MKFWKKTESATSILEVSFIKKCIPPVIFHLLLGLDLLKKMLEKDPKLRISAKEALDH